MFGTGKDKRLLPVVCLDQMDQQFTFARFVDGIDDLGDLLGSGIASGNFDQGRLVE